MICFALLSALTSIAYSAAVEQTASTLPSAASGILAEAENQFRLGMGLRFVIEAGLERLESRETACRCLSVLQRTGDTIQVEVMNLSGEDVSEERIGLVVAGRIDFEKFGRPVEESFRNFVNTIKTLRSLYHSSLRLIDEADRAVSSLRASWDSLSEAESIMIVSPSVIKLLRSAIVTETIDAAAACDRLHKAIFLQVSI